MRKIERTIAGAFLFSNDGFVLLGKNKAGGVFENKWVVPGGGVDEGEEILDAMKREILEEVGINVEGAEIEFQADVQSGTSEKTLRDTGERVEVLMHFNDFVVRIDQPASAIPIILEDDFGYAEWVPLGDLQERSYSPTTEYRLKALGLVK